MQKKITVTNSGKNMTSFKILVNNGYLDGVFEYDYAPRHPLAPGMNAKLTVTYKCKSLADVYELVTIYTNENKKANILVYVENPSPILKCKYLLKTPLFNILFDIFLHLAIPFFTPIVTVIIRDILKLKDYFLSRIKYKSLLWRSYTIKKKTFSNVKL